MINYTIYVVDDETTITEGIKLALDDQYRIVDFSDAEKAIAAIEKDPPDLVLLDIGLPGMNGVEALGEIKARFPDILVIMITAYEDVDTVISAMKLGAHDYVIKPLHMDGLEITIRNALDTIQLRKEVQSLQARYLRENLPCFIGESRAIVDVMEFVEDVAQSPDTPILLVGETGTGKELIASSIHYRSPNFKGPLATVNCAAIPRDLIESELFGYEKGAFSGARASGKKGLIEEATNGTLFLDEVGDLSLDAQAKLLRFLETGEFYRVGGTKKLLVKTRVVSATNKNIEEMIERRLFRKDLFFRLGVIRVEVPSLNERREDIIPMAKHFLYEYARKFKKRINEISPEAGKTLLEHNWTGNVRELKNMIERGVLTGKGTELSPADLGIDSPSMKESPGTAGAPIRFPPVSEAGVDLAELERAMEKYYINEAYELAKGNESLAAKLLNINHHTYRYRRKKLLEE
jgi:DNA-binding NtrC family response regulator